MNDSTLAERIAQRDPVALEELVHRYHPDVYRFLHHLTRHCQEAEDLAQQTLLKAIANISKYSDRGVFRSWLLGVAYREFTTWRRRRLWLPLTVDQPSTEDPYSRLADAQALLAAISKLPLCTRAVFLMHYVEDVPVLEIAETLRLPEGTVKSRLHSARTRLRTYLKEETPNVPEPC